MSCRQSGRSSKSIDYSSFGGGDDDDFEDDDDFKDCTPPVKKQKLSKDKKPKKEKRKTQDVKENENVKRKNPTPRPSVDDKIFERELQLVMEMSKTESSPSKEIPVLIEHAVINESNCKTQEIIAKSEIKDVKNRCEKSANILPVEDLDKIEVLEEDIPEKESKGRRRRASSNKIKYKFDDESDDEKVDSDFSEEDSNDDDFKMAGERADDSDEDFAADGSDEDEDFAPKAKITSSKKAESKIEVSKKTDTKSKAISPKPKPQIKEATIQKSKPTVSVKPSNSKPTVSVKSSNSKPKGSSSTPVSSSLAKKSVTSSGLVKSSPLGRAPTVRKTFTPPSTTGTKSSLGGVAVKSPGGLRLGLSRNARVKPLHSNVKLPT